MDKPKVDKTFRFPTCMEEMPLGPTVKAGILTETNAGWRVKRPVIDRDKCIHCLICWTLCPDGVLSKELEIDMDFCKGCGLCAHECPKGAITMVSEVDGQ